MINMAGSICYVWVIDCYDEYGHGDMDQGIKLCHVMSCHYNVSIDCSRIENIIDSRLD